MIKYALKCSQDHGFEGWFSNSGDYDQQHADGLLECPVCGTDDVEKALMAPAVNTSRRARTTNPKLAEVSDAIIDTARRARDYVEKNFENVGKSFPEEARKIHYGETDERPIFGEATPKEASELKEEGVSIAPVPDPPPAADEVKRKLN